MFLWTKIGLVFSMSKIRENKNALTAVVICFDC